MRKINKDFDAIPDALNLARNEFCKQDLKIAIDARTQTPLTDRPKFVFKISRYRQENVVFSLENDIYNYKCAFCETDPTAGARLQVEHYRPKSAVKNEPTHAGYYWLAYEWTNLLLACSVCNIAKSSHFPIQNERCTAHQALANGDIDVSKSHILHDILQNEQPLLLNPEIDSLRLHLAFLPKGKIEAITKHGKKTIKIIKLDRKPLTVARNKLYNQFLGQFLRAFKYFSEDKITKNELENRIQDTISDILDVYLENEPYSEYAYACWQDFETFYINKFETEDADILRKVYADVKKIQDDFMQ
jgi:5-methylcytosine-specific restriction endonuclease McrA